MLDLSQSGSVWLRALLHTVALRGSVGEPGASVMLMLQGLEMSRAIPTFPQLHITGRPFMTIRILLNPYNLMGCETFWLQSMRQNNALVYSKITSEIWRAVSLFVSKFSFYSPSQASF